jgi:hypothetical protein
MSTYVHKNLTPLHEQVNQENEARVEDIRKQWTVDPDSKSKYLKLLSKRYPHLSIASMK